MEALSVNYCWKQPISDPRLLELAQEAASVYNFAMKTFWKYLDPPKGKSKYLGPYAIQKKIYKKIKRNLLSSASTLAAIQQFSKAFKSYSAAHKEWVKNPKKFTSEPLPPHKEKKQTAIFFKDDTIRLEENELWLSLANGQEPIKVPWNEELGKPRFAVVSWLSRTGWEVSFTFEREVDECELDFLNLMSIDLGSKRIAATFDFHGLYLFSGKKIRSLIRLRNKIDADTMRKLAHYKKHSRKYKHIKQANRKVIRRIQNQINDILHKYSRTIVNRCKKEKIGVIAIGDCSGIHDGTHLGPVVNQTVQQGPEQKLAKQVKYKFAAIGGTVIKIPEYYTSKQCPECSKLNEPNNRDYKCKGKGSCGFEFDRDGVGCVNIWMRHKKVAFGAVLDVVGSLTEPIGLKFHASSQDCLTKVVRRASRL